MKTDIVVIGSSNTDMIVKTPYIPLPGETILGGTFNTAAGGKGANQAVSCARAGGKVTFVARVGDDMFGEQALRGFRKDGINVDFVVKDGRAPSGVALIIVDDKGQNSIAVASGANSNLSVPDVEAAADTISSAAFLLMQLEIPIETVAAAARMAADKNVRVILNPAPAQPLSDELLRNVTIITPNETEASMLTGIKVEDQASACKAAETLVSKGVKSVIITMGSAGAYVHCDDFRGMVPGFKVEAVDTTAAGDTFSGTLAVALAEGKTLEQATVFANAAAALSVTKLGAQPSAPNRAAIEQFQKERKR